MSADDDQDNTGVHDRRMEDMRLLRMEEALNKVTAKINNGLSSRSKETMERVRELSSSQHTMERQVIENATHVDVIQSDICEIKDSLLIVAQSQQNWMKMFNRGLIIAVVGMFSLMGWFIMHIDTIDAVLDHIEEAGNTPVAQIQLNYDPSDTYQRLIYPPPGIPIPRRPEPNRPDSKSSIDINHNKLKTFKDTQNY